LQVLKEGNAGWKKPPARGGGVAGAGLRGGYDQRSLPGGGDADPARPVPPIPKKRKLEI